MTGVDVSDLGLTVADVEAPLPEEFFEGFATTGFESTSSTNPDDSGAQWRESKTSLEVTLTIAGFRGQPSGAFAVEMTETTATVTAFGYVVWSCVLRGAAAPETARVEVSDGEDMVPIIKITVDKKDAGASWGGFIESVGENSLL